MANLLKQLDRLFLKVPTGVKKWAYNASAFNQLGLRRDDVIQETPDVEEALRRLPPHLLEERNFRLIRAMHLDCQKRLLPKEQWTKYEEDEHYLLPILQEVIAERHEKEKWNAE